MNIEIHFKVIKSLRLKVRGNAEPVRVSAPYFVSDTVIYEFVERNLDWIAHKQTQLSQRTQDQLQYLHDENHSVWGELKTLKLEPNSVKNTLICGDNNIIIQCKGSATPEYNQSMLEHFYRQQIQTQIPGLLHKWQPIIGRSVKECRIKKMRTRWGTCNIQAKRIWLSLELAKKPLPCLEYVFVHEMVHLHERNHTKRFYQLMSEFLPEWQEREILLNRNETQASEM